MRYVIRTLLGMALFAFCWVAIGYAIYQLLQVGTCASGGPYVSARECPDGIERLMFSIFGAIVGLFVAAGIYSGRGAPPGSDASRPTARSSSGFGPGFSGASRPARFLGVWGPERIPGPGGKEGGLIVGFMGLIMGAGGLLAIGFGRSKSDRSSRQVRPVVSRMVGTATKFSGGAHAVDRLESLERMRRQGHAHRCRVRNAEGEDRERGLMVTESSSKAIPVILHALGIALGIYLGFIAMAAIAPDMPDDSVEPGVSSSITPEAVAADDSASLFLSRTWRPRSNSSNSRWPPATASPSCGSSRARSRSTRPAETTALRLADVSPACRSC